MIDRTGTVKNKLGLHARPAALVVQVAGRFVSEITLSKDGLAVNGKSIMGVMMLAAGQGSVLRVSATGIDEEQAAEDMVRVIESGFGEE